MQAHKWIVLAAAWLTVVAVGCKTNRDRTMEINPTRAYVDARSALLQAVNDPDNSTRTKALEALAETEGPSAGPAIMEGLRDDNGAVRFAAAMAAGDTRYEPALGPLLEMAADPAISPRLLCATIYALHNLREDKFTGELGRLLHHKDKWVVATAAMVMGRMGEPSGVGPLKTIQTENHDPDVQLQVVEALASLGDERSGALIEAFTKSQFMEDRLMAVAALGRLRQPRSLNVLRKILDDRNTYDPIVRVAAAGALARLDQPHEAADLISSALTEPEKCLRLARGEKVDIRDLEVAAFQTQAALATAYMTDTWWVDELHPLLKSPRGPVRVAAAKAILNLLKAYRPATRTMAPPPEEPEALAPPPERPKLYTSGGKD